MGPPSRPTSGGGGGGVHTFKGRLTDETVSVSGLAELTLLGFDWDGGAHIPHLLFPVPVGSYDPDKRLFGCRGELTLEGLPSITNILAASFGARRTVRAVSWDDH